MKPFTLILLLLFSLLVLAACDGLEAKPAVIAPAVMAPEITAPQVNAPQVEVSEINRAPAVAAPPHETLVDEQGAVAVSVTPLNLSEDAATLDFEVAINTHSVDLSMDLAELATLTTDAGAAVRASAWSGTPGGHHVTGVLYFPAEEGGASLLVGTTTISLALENVGAPMRTFTWSLR